jgi:glutamate-1-semialdehyde 2,1-aminomutase
MIKAELKIAGRRDGLVRIGSMFCLFCIPSGQKVRNLADAQKSDRSDYARLFHGLLRKGVYFPPSQFETCFLSAAHGARELALTRKALRVALRRA